MRPKGSKHMSAVPIELAQSLIYLRDAAKMVETAAFEMARHVPATLIEELLALSCGIENIVRDLEAMD